MNALDVLPGETALAYAKRQVEWYRTNPIDLMGVQVRFLDPADGEAFAADAAARCLATGRIDPAHAEREAAAGDALFYDALCQLAALELEGELTLEEPLRASVIAMLRNPPRIKRARRKETNYFRDVCLTMLVQEVRDRFGLTATGRSSRRPSACGIVADALGMERDAVQKAVGKFIHKI